MKNNVLNWANQFGTFCFLDNHDYRSPLTSLECILAAGIQTFLKADAGNALDQLQQFISARRGWVFGHLSYDLKNEIEAVTSSHPDHVQFPDLFFFRPEVLIKFDQKEMIIESAAGNEEKIVDEILNAPDSNRGKPVSINILNRVEKEEYASIFQQLKHHIVRGDCYEINFCQEFYGENIDIDPLGVYKKLSVVSPSPFSALYKLHDKYLVCASPERFLKKKGNRIISQPMKGTQERRDDGIQDDHQRRRLFNNAKERSENVMVVDLVRNDLSRICREGTVTVDELCGIYSFPNVHQMISTVSGKLQSDVSFADIARATFPMGSMTGAPKRKVMELIEHYEKTKRGIFSGTVGYITPDNDFDFNVVIRSIMYNVTRKYVSVQTGSGITFYSDPEKEWEECLLKARGLMRALKSV